MNIINRLNENIKKMGPDECWPWIGNYDEYGYGIIFYDDNQRKAHRIVHKYYNKEEIKGYVIRHTCDNPRCCNPKHLIRGSHSDNVADRVKRNRSAVASKNGRSKLTEEQVIEIFLNKNDTNVYLGAKYGVDPKVIFSIKTRKTWKTTTAHVAKLVETHQT